MLIEDEVQVLSSMQPRDRIINVFQEIFSLLEKEEYINFLYFKKATDLYRWP